METEEDSVPIIFHDSAPDIAVDAAPLWIPDHESAFDTTAAAAAQAAHLAQAANTDTSGSENLHIGFDSYDASEAEMLKRTTKKKSKGGRIASEITREELSECFNMASEDAAKKLGVGLTVLKRICRKFGVPRWPYRKLKSLDRLITNVESGTPPGETYKHLMKSADEIRMHQKAMCMGSVLELDEKTKKLQQAYSKFNHKLRKATRDDDSSGMHIPVLDMASSADGKECKLRSGDDVHQDQGTAMGLLATEDAPSMAPEAPTQEQMMYMPMTAMTGMPFAMPMMMVDPAYQQHMMAVQQQHIHNHNNSQGQDLQQQQVQQQQQHGEPQEQQQQSEPQHQPQAMMQHEQQQQQQQLASAVNCDYPAEATVQVPGAEAGTGVIPDAAAAAAAHMAAAAAAWGHYAVPQASAEAAAAYWKSWAAAPKETEGQDPTAVAQAQAAAASAASAAGYYVHPMVPYMAAGQQGYTYPFIPGYMPAYDPASMQHYYQAAQQAWMQPPQQHPSTATPTTPAAPPGADPMTMYPMMMMTAAPQQGTEGAAEGDIDPSQAAAAAAQAQAQAQAGYAYVQYVHPHWAGHGVQHPAQQMLTSAPTAAAAAAASGPSSCPPVACAAAPEATQTSAPTSDAQPVALPRGGEGKRKRRPSIKYEGDFTHGDELDSIIDSSQQGAAVKTEPHTTPAAASSDLPTIAEPQLHPEQQQQQQQQEGGGVVGGHPSMMAVQPGQLPMAHPGMMVHPGMMAVGWGAFPGMDMGAAGGQADPAAHASSFYPPMMMMPGYTYNAAG